MMISRTTPQSAMEFSRMTVMDLDEICAIEQRSYPFPWTCGVFTDSLNAGYRSWVGRKNGVVVAYALMMVVLDEVHLLNICVMPELQGQGLGKELLDYLFEDARGLGTKFMFLEVRPSNVNALEMYRRFGFAIIGQRRGYYPAALGREDAIVMSCDLHAAPRQERAA